MREAAGGLGTKPDDLQQLLRAGLRLRLRHALGDRSVGECAHDPLARVERGIGVLEHHLHLVALLAQLFLGERRQIGAADQHLPAVGRHQPHGGAAQRRLARSALAHQPQHLAAPDGERDVIHRAHFAHRAEHAAASTVDLAQPLDLQRRHLARRTGGRQLAGGDRIEQTAGVLVLRVGEHRGRAAALDHPALAHDDHLVGDLGHHAEVVGDEHHRHAALVAQVEDQLEDLRLRRHVERCRRLVGNQQLRLERQRHGDHRPLTLPAGELEGIGTNDLLGVRQANLANEVQRLLAPLLLGKAVMGGEDLGDLLADAHQRIERGHRLLKDHRDARPAQRLLLGLGQAQDVARFEHGAAGFHAHARRQQPHQRIRGHRLSRATFADHAKDLAFLDAQRHVLDSEGAIGPLRQSDAEMLDGQSAHALPFRLRWGFRASFSPSPMRFSASTVITMAMPGKKLSHQALRITVRAAPIM